MCFHTFRYEYNGKGFTVSVMGETPAQAAINFVTKSTASREARTAFEFTAKHVGTTPCQPRDWFTWKECWG